MFVCEREGEKREISNKSKANKSINDFKTASFTTYAKKRFQVLFALRSLFADLQKLKENKDDGSRRSGWQKAKKSISI